MDYFTRDTDLAIDAFKNADNDVEKHRIFNEEIRPSLEKLIENLIFVYQFYTIDDVETLKNECLANLYETLPKYDINRGKKGFSYFNIVAKNWFIQKIRDKARNAKNRTDLHRDIDRDLIKSDSNLRLSSHEDEMERVEFWRALDKELERWRGEVSKDSERQVLEAIIFLMRNGDMVSIYNKKAVYLYLREMTNLNTKQVVINLKKFKKMFQEWKSNYLDTGESQ
jgi:hypothetical protein